MTTTRNYDSIRRDLVARAQDCIHYFASLVSEKTSGFESTFATRSLRGKLVNYEHALESLTECINLSRDMVTALRGLRYHLEAANELERFTDALSAESDRLIAVESIESSTELRTMGRRGFVAFEAWLEKMHINGYEGKDLDLVSKESA